MAIEITEADRKKAFELFDQGEPVNRVALLLFKGHWYKAKKLHDEHRKLPAAVVVGASAEQEREAVCVEPDIGPEVVADVVEQEPEEQEPLNELEPVDEPAVWDVTVQVPTERMDQIIANFTSQEKADAIAMVLTARLSAEA